MTTTMKMRMTTRGLFLAGALAAAALGTGCASARSSGPAEARPGREFTFEDQDYRMLVVDTDFVLLRRVGSDSGPGEITGFVQEVFRVSRYDLGEGRWYVHRSLPGTYIQWRGGDSFALTRDRSLLRGAEVATLPMKARSAT